MLAVYLVFMSLAIYHRNKSTYIYFKTLTSLTFVAAGIYYGYRVQNFYLIPTLIGFMIGDIMLATKLRRSFIYGMGGFFLADVWFVCELYRIKPITVLDFVLPVFVIIFITVIGKYPKMHLGHYKKPMYGYGFVLALSVASSVGCYLMYGTRAYLCLAVGMVFYFISDFLLMFQYFYKTNYRDYLKLAKMLFYFVGAYLIAYSIAA